MRILHIIPTYFPAVRYGGPVYSVQALCAALVRRGHEIHVYTTNVDGPDVSSEPLGVPVALDGVNVTYFPTGIGRRLFRSPLMGAKINEVAASFDVLHLHSAFLWPTAAAAAAARRWNVPYILSPRGMLVDDLIRRKSRIAKTVWIKLFELRNLASAAAVHVTSRLEADELSRIGFSSRRIAVIRNGIDLPPVVIARHRPSLVDKFPSPRVVFLGRINWKKGLDRLIPAMAHVPEGHLIIAGNDEERYIPALRKLAELNGVSDRTHFLGPVYGSEKWILIAAADVFALPSYSENFGVAVLEAMACGVPVVVTPQVGMAEVVGQVGAGLVCSGDVQEFGSAIAEIIADHEKRLKFGRAGRKAAEELFSWSTIAQEMERLYSEVVNDSGRAKQVA